MPSTAKRSGNPAKRAAAQEEKKQYGRRVWGRTSGNEDGTIDLELPSGEEVKVIRPGLQGLIEAGVLHNIDSLSALVDEKHLKRVQGKPEVDVQSLMKDEKNLQNLFHTVDRVLCHCVVEPQVLMTPNDPTSRKQGEHIYADQVPIEDKMFILDFAVGGNADLERFRRETTVALGSVADEPEVSSDPI